MKGQERVSRVVSFEGSPGTRYSISYCWNWRIRHDRGPKAGLAPANCGCLFESIQLGLLPLTGDDILFSIGSVAGSRADGRVAAADGRPGL